MPAMWRTPTFWQAPGLLAQAVPVTMPVAHYVPLIAIWSQRRVNHEQAASFSAQCRVHLRCKTSKLSFW